MSDNEKDDPDFKPNKRFKLGSEANTVTRQAALRAAASSDQVAPELPPKKSKRLENKLNVLQPVVNPFSSPITFSSVNPLTPTGSESSFDKDQDIMAEAAYRDMQKAFTDIAISNKLNDMRAAHELPFFGRAKDPTGKTWVVDNIEELITHVSKQTPGESWNDAGRIKLLRSKLCGLARDYFNDFTGTNLDEAKEYLLKMYPDTTSYASLYQEIIKIQRKSREQVSDYAVRVKMLYARLKNLSQGKLSDD